METDITDRKSLNLLNGITVISNRSDVIDFIKKSLGDNSVYNINSQIVEVAFVTSTIVFLDISLITINNIDIVLSLLKIYNSKILLIVPFSFNRELLKPIFLFCERIIPYPSDIFIAKNYIHSYISSEKEKRNSIVPNINENEIDKYRELDCILGNSVQILEVKKRIIECAKNDTPVLLLGETGTGKSTIAKIIHKLSSRKNEAYSQLNISTVAENLAESTLFGTEQGAYTDAHKREGLLKANNKGTVFIDEIGTMPLTVQSKLLVFLDTGDFYTLGSDKIQHVDVRLITATNDNMKIKMMEGAFRKDLFFRISGDIIMLPPLRERKGDISIIAKRMAAEKGKILTAEAIEKLENYDWPGNIRQLKQCLERAFNRGNPQIDLEDLEWYNY